MHFPRKPIVITARNPGHGSVPTNKYVPERFSKQKRDALKTQSDLRVCLEGVSVPKETPQSGEEVVSNAAAFGMSGNTSPKRCAKFKKIVAKEIREEGRGRQPQGITREQGKGRNWGSWGADNRRKIRSSQFPLASIISSPCFSKAFPD